jgi:hypothetical protein
MRLGLRLFTLAVLLSAASFTNLLSPVSQASACTDGCGNGNWECRQDCNAHPLCGRDCAAEFDSCLAHCKPEDD